MTSLMSCSFSFCVCSLLKHLRIIFLGFGGRALIIYQTQLLILCSVYVMNTFVLCVTAYLYQKHTSVHLNNCKLQKNSDLMVLLQHDILHQNLLRSSMLLSL